VEEPLIVADSFGRYGWRVREDDVIGGSAPIAFGAGYCTFAVIPYRFGAAASLIARFNPEKMLQTIEKHRVTILSILPTAYRRMLQVPDAKKRYDLSSLRVCTGGGESLTAQTYHDWRDKFGLEIFEGFGTTEMMYVFISNTVNMRARPGSFGQVVPGYEARVVDDDGQDCPPGQIGHLIVRGPTGTLYWRDPEKQAHAGWHGWHRAGDYVYRDEDGYFWFVSREDDVIKSSGYRIGPEEIENTLVKHPAVADAGVIGVPHPVRGQNAKALIVLREGYEPSEALKQELIDFCRGKIAVYKLPREVEFVDELPRTVTGKLLRRILRERERGNG
jgi:2-aminobenzoate-CoA ligase